MIGKQEIKNARYYVAFFALLLVLLVYANESGWRMYSTDEVEHSSAEKSRNSRTRFYHK